MDPQVRRINENLDLKSKSLSTYVEREFQIVFNSADKNLIHLEEVENLSNLGRSSISDNLSLDVNIEASNSSKAEKSNDLFAEDTLYSEEARIYQDKIPLNPKIFEVPSGENLYAQIAGYYDYGNGERYEISGIIEDIHGGLSLEEGQKVFANTSSLDAFNNDTNETDNQGYYYLESVDFFEINLTDNY